MFIPEKMKVNKFEDVAIPSNKSFFARLGQVSLPSSSYTGDEPAPIDQRKVDELNMFEQYAEQMAKESK